MWLRGIAYGLMIIFILANVFQAIITDDSMTRLFCYIRAGSHVVFLVIFRVIMDREKDAIKIRDQFLSVVSHELKTPLTSIYLTLQLVKTKVQTQKENSVVDKALQACEHMNRLIRAYLDIHNIEHRKPLQLYKADLNLVEIVKAIVEINQYKRVKISAPSELTVSADQDRIFQVVDNLLSNAVKYGGGNPISLSLEAEGDKYAVIKVCDQGIGMTISDQKKIFKPFMRANSSVGGTGLGLYVSKEIVAAHEGEIFVHSEPGKGSCFIVKIPLGKTSQPFLKPEQKLG